MKELSKHRITALTGVNTLFNALVNNPEFGKLDFSNMFVALGTVPEGTAPTLAAVKAAGVPVLAYGNFLSVAINFLILAFVIFLMVKQINRMKREAPAAPEAPAVTPEDVLLLREIRDSLKK